MITIKKRIHLSKIIEKIDSENVGTIYEKDGCIRALFEMKRHLKDKRRVLAMFQSIMGMVNYRTIINYNFLNNSNALRIFWSLFKSSRLSPPNTSKSGKIFDL